MAPAEPSRKERWIHSDQLILPKQNLSLNDVPGFLDYLFHDVATKPRQLGLRETASVARYLMALANAMLGGDERVLLESLAKMIWLTLLDCGRIRIADKQQVIDFLGAHRKTYLNSFDVEHLVQFVQGLGEPIGQGHSFRPPRLMGTQRSVQGGGKAQLQDDLTERIYAAYYGLQRAGARNVRGEIAKALNRAGLKTRAKPGTDSAWGSAEVIERIRQFEDRLVRRNRLNRRPDRLQQIERLRDMLVDSWIHGFHFARNVESQSYRAR